MAKQLGKNFRLFRGNAASPEVFTEIAGQSSLSRDGSTNLIDQSSKSDFPYAVQAPGRTTLQIQCSGNRDLPDASGLEAVYAQFLGNPQTAANFSIRDVSVSPDAEVFQASMYVSNFSQSDDDEGNGEFSFTLTLAAAPTVDDLTP